MAQFKNGLGDDYLSAVGGTTVTAPEPTLFQRFGYGAMTAMPRAVSGIESSIQTLLGGNTVGEEVPTPEEAEKARLTNLTPATTTAGKVTDFAMQGVLPMAMEMIMTGGVARAGLGKALARTPVAERAAIDAVQLGQLGLHEDKLTGLEQAGEGAAFGLLSGMSRASRLPLAALLGFGSQQFFDRNGREAPIESLPDVSQGDLAGTVGALAALLPGKTPWRLPDHFATVAKDSDRLLLGDRPKPEMLRLLDRGIEGQVVADPGVARLMGGPGMIDNEGAIRAGFSGEAPMKPLGLPGPEAPPEGRLTYEGGVVKDYGDISLQEQRARVPKGEVTTGGLVRHVNPKFEQYDMEVVGRSRPGFISVRLPSGAVTEMGERAVLAAPPVIRMPDGPGLWSPEFNASALKVMQDWGEKVGIAREQMARMNDAFDLMGVRDHNAKISMMWKMIQQELKGVNVEADFNPQLSKLSIPKGQIPLDENARIARVASQYLSGQELQSLQKAEAVKGRIAPSQAEIQLAEQSAMERARQAYLSGENEKLRQALREIPESYTSPTRSKVHDLPEFKRTEGGAVDPDFLLSMGAAAGRAAIGGTVGGLAGGEEGTVAGAAAGLSPEVLRLMFGIGSAIKKGVKNLDEAGMVRDPFFEKPIGRKRIISTAIKNPDGTVITGEKWNSKHMTLMMEHMQYSDDVKSSQVMDNMGFLIEDEKGFIRWADRGESARIAQETDQAGQGYRGNRLISEDLQPDAEIKEASLQPLQKEPKLKPLSNPLEGSILPELSAGMGRAVVGSIIGGSIGGATEGQDGFVKGAMIGAAAGTFGPSAARALIQALSKIKSSPSGIPKVSPKGWYKMAANLGQTVEEASGRAFSASASPVDRFIRWMDQSLDITIPAIVKEALMKSKGLAANLMDIMDQAMLKLSWRFKVTPDIEKLTNKYLNDSTAYKPADYIRDMKALNPNDPNMERYAEFAIAGRKAMDGLQKLAADGIGDPKMKKIIEDSFGRYVTRSYKIFTNPSWEPSQESIRNLITEMQKSSAWKNVSADDLYSSLNQYVREIKQTKGIYRGDHSPKGAMIAQSILKERKVLSKEWREFLGEITNPTERIYQTIFRLRPMAEASHYFNELVTKTKEDGWLPHYFSNYSELTAFENQLLQRLQNAKQGTPEFAEAQARLDKFKLKWEGQQNVENHPKFGELKGGIVTRNVWDTLRTYDNATDTFKSPLLRAGMNFHTAVKLARTAFNPITVVRNFVTMPMFMAMARVGVSDINDAAQVIKAATPEMKALREEIMRQGIGNVDQVRTEFFKEFENITGSQYNFGEFDMTNLGMGKIDLDALERGGRRGVRQILDVYRYPDNLIRIGSYLSAKRRFAEALKLPENAQEVLDAATRFTNRYTMNYDAVAPLVKSVRQLPFFNLFITYTSEMIRIMKNLGEDIVNGTDGISHDRMYAAFPLATLAVLPEIAQSMSEDSLSPSDRKDWEKAKQLMPDYARTRYRFVTGRDKKTGEFHYTDFTPLVASDSLNQLVKAVAAGDSQAALSVNPFVGVENTPLLNIASSQIVGKDLRTHREFRGKPLSPQNLSDRFATIAKEALPPWVPGVGSEALRYEQAHATNSEGGKGVTNLKTGYKITPQDFWMPYWSGLRPGSTSLGPLVQKNVAEAKQEIAKETAYLKDIMNSNLPDSQKEKALEKFKIVVGEIQENLRQLIETP